MGSLLSLYPPVAPPGESTATQTEWNCPVCHSVLSDTAAVPCGHQSCLGCLLRHTASSPTCPLCDAPVLSARFSVQDRNDFLQCILIPPREPPGPGSWARRALFRLVYERPPGPPGPAEPAEPPRSPEAAEELPADLWAELLHGHEQLLEPVRPWLRQSLDAIYGPQWWEARQVESIALSTLCICGPDSAGLTHMLRGYLGDYTAPLIRGLIHATVHRCRDAWLRRRAQPAPEAQEEQQEQEEQEEGSPAASAGSSSPRAAPALGLAPDPAGLGLGSWPGQLDPALLPGALTRWDANGDWEKGRHRLAMGNAEGLGGNLPGGSGVTEEPQEETEGLGGSAVSSSRTVPRSWHPPAAGRIRTREALTVSSPEQGRARRHGHSRAAPPGRHGPGTRLPRALSARTHPAGLSQRTRSRDQRRAPPAPPGPCPVPSLPPSRRARARVVRGASLSRRPALIGCRAPRKRKWRRKR
ncbi:uncharacterized protein LOC131572592 [Poecile atricapillus]|uniref:uncharacterized protein LOC131572592 n=1 Tax=Poecile atricapillus TaxID=48891 RepID=UPI0027382018|nr:uncharacterized protein LOC131572592 [Poecile atricapillus]